MKKMGLALIILAALYSQGCEACSKEFRHLKSSTVGLDRTITLLDCSGKEIRSWRTRSYVEVDGATASWIGDDGKEVKVSGSFVIQEN